MWIVDGDLYCREFTYLPGRRRGTCDIRTSRRVAVLPLGFPLISLVDSHHRSDESDREYETRGLVERDRNRVKDRGEADFPSVELEEGSTGYTGFGLVPG